MTVRAVHKVGSLTVALRTGLVAVIITIVTLGCPITVAVIATNLTAIAVVAPPLMSPAIANSLKNPALAPGSGHIGGPCIDIFFYWREEFVGG